MVTKKGVYQKQILRKKMLSVITCGIVFLIATIAFYFVNTSRAQNVESLIVSVIDKEAKLEAINYELKVEENDDGFYTTTLPKIQNGYRVLRYKIVSEDEYKEIEKLYPEYEEEEKEENFDETITIKEVTEDTAKNEENNDTKVVEQESAVEEEKPENINEESEESIVQDNKEEIVVEDDLESTEEETDENLEETEEEELLISGEEIVLGNEQIESKQLFLVAQYDSKEIEGEMLYNKKISQSMDKNIINIIGYLPVNAEISVSELKTDFVEEKIKDSMLDVEKEVKLSSAYDIKIIVDGEEFEPEDFGENVKVFIQGIDEKVINIWHLKNDDSIEIIDFEANNDDDIVFETDEFSIYGIESEEEIVDKKDENQVLEKEAEPVNEDPGKLEPRKAPVRAVGDSTLVIDDHISDYYYYKGKNYTDNMSQVLTTYTDSNLVTVTLNYHGFAYGETNNDMKGRISLDETEDIVQNIRTAPIESGNVTIELMENPFMDKPSGYGFAGWTASSGIISTDSHTLTQTLTVPTNGNITVDLYANWATANVVYVSSTSGCDDGTYNGLSASTPFGSWSSAFNYLYSHNSNDRERNIIVVVGNMDCSINHTQPVYKITQRPGTVSFTSSTSIITNQTILISDGQGAGANALTTNGSIVFNVPISTSVMPYSGSEWTITSSGSGSNIRYYIRSNQNTNLYLGYSSTNGLTVSTSQTGWRLNNRRLYVSSGGYNRYIRYENGGWTTTTTQNQGTQLYFLRYTGTQGSGADVTSFVKGGMASNSNYTSSRSVPVTITSLYDHTDFRTTATLNLTTADRDDFNVYKDLQMNHVKINASGYKSNSGRHDL